MIFKMKKATGTIKKTTVKKPTIIRAVKRTEDDRFSRENFISDIAKKLSGFEVSTDIITKMFSDIDIKPDQELTNDDLILIYNLLTEPLLSTRETGTAETENKSKILYGEKELSGDEYSRMLLRNAGEFEGGFISERVVSMYEYLPSLETSRTNFLIDKDIFRDKPLLGEGLYECSKCGSKNTEDYQVQTRSADEPMTTFVRCKDCKTYYKYI
jgi:DNA-directed RNA polymerase subunit M/transcription elongation factor TFIIS